MISGAAQADVCLLMVPADGNFTTAIQKGDHKANEIQGQTRQHARLINLLGVKQLIVGVNKMDSDVAGYKQERYQEIANEMKHMLAKVGWKPDFIEKSVPILPISGWQGDNLIKKSDNMAWWKGQDVLVGKDTVHVDCLYDALEKMVRMPERKTNAPLRLPISGAYKIKGVGDVLAGRVEQGTCFVCVGGDFDHVVSSWCQLSLLYIIPHHTTHSTHQNTPHTPAPPSR